MNFTANLERRLLAFLGWSVFPVASLLGISTVQAEVPLKLNAFLEERCLDCHTSGAPDGGIALDDVSLEVAALDSQLLERVVRKLRTRQMPPLDYGDRPSEQQYESVVSELTEVLDRRAQEYPNPGRTATLRRLTRTEYQNAIRDLLALDIDSTKLLPADESSGGFDNITVGDLTPTLVNRYISAAELISRLAVGVVGRAPRSETIRIKPDITQKGHVEGLPLGTRGGAVIAYNFPKTGRYRIEIRLARDRNEHVEGIRGKHTLEVLLDRSQVGSFEVKPPKGGDHSTVDAHLAMEFGVRAGPHEVGVTFVSNGDSLMETMRQPLESQFNTHRHPRQNPALYQVSITGPVGRADPDVASSDVDSSHEVVDTPSRRRIFGNAYPGSASDEDSSALTILTTLARRGYRRQVGEADLTKPMSFYRASRDAGGEFDEAIQAAVSSILVSPNFLFRVETDPPGVASGTVYPLSDVELASRLSFFLTSSIPDDELLDVALRGELSRPGELEKQAMRLLQSDASASLTTNFAAQWLYLRNIDSFTPDGRLYPDFDDNLRQAFRTETEMLFESIVRDDQSVLRLIDSDYTFLNERLAKHYGIPHIYGSHFRRVKVDESSHRGGILRHGSILTVTSYATRTSPVIRGYWVLKNVLGAPPPPPPDDVPALEDNTVSVTLPLRERLAAHRENPACASCHELMDPIGFALENYDAIGRWREREAGFPIDASGNFADGTQLNSVAGLEQALLRRPELFVTAMVEKLLMFAVGRPVEHYDAPSIRKVVREAQLKDFQFSAIISGIVTSDAFLKRRAP